MKASTSERPDLDWSQIRETLTMVALAVVQIKASMSESNESAERLSTAVTEISSNLQKIRTSYLQDNHSSEEFDQIDRDESVVAQALIPDYLTAMPNDPLTDRNFYGYRSADGRKYDLTCIIEDQSDPQAKKVGSIYLFYLTSQ